MKSFFIFILTLFFTAGMAAALTACEVEPVPEEIENEDVAVEPVENDPEADEEVLLPEPGVDEITVSEALYDRVSVRDFSDAGLDLSAIGNLLWAAGGLGVDAVTGATRTTPSAGGTYPLDLYLVAGTVEGLEPGVFRYDHENHALLPVAAGDRREQLAGAAVDQQFIADAAVNIVMVAHYQRTMGPYGERGERYVHMDVGYASQSVHLMVEELKLGTVAVGAFDDAETAEIIATEGAPLLIMPVGVPQ